MAACNNDQKSFSVTYGELIDLYENACSCASDQGQNFEDVFIEQFRATFPTYHVSRPKRFIETVQRIVGPTKPSLRGPSKLSGSSLATYRSRMWEPKLTNPKGSSSDVEFPMKLYSNFGIDEELLGKCINAVLTGTESPWVLCADSTARTHFYKLIHPFLKKWKKTQHSTKSVIGKFYLEIDESFSGKRPDNVYKYVDLLCTKNPDQCSPLINHSRQVIHLSEEICELRENLKLSTKQLQVANRALRDITNEKNKLEKERDSALRKATKYQQSHVAATKDIERLIEDLETLDSLSEPDVSTSYAPINEAAIQVTTTQQGDFTITKSGKFYSNSVRKLYYTLLSSGVPASKISNLVKDIVKWSNPLVDVSKLELPKRSCASYIRQEELKVISNAHKATSLCTELSSGKALHINTDGTTKNQKKISGIAINGMTISVNEVVDGSSLATINDVARELEKLRVTAQALGLPNADSVNWSFIESSTSDAAATQKHFNDLLYEKKEANCVDSSTDLTFVENFCSIHLGVNLRKAFLTGLHASDGTHPTNHFPVDTLVHQFCKVFGRQGTPEYGCGGQQFPDFLSMMCDNISISKSKVQYYQQCLETKLQRQVGNRYFVTACNASSIIFLLSAAIEFMEFTGRDKNGNKLEKELYQKLKDEQEIVEILLDSLMYYHVYADLVVISKSTQLNKSTLDVNTHYLELKCFLTEAVKFPELVLKQESEVFVSERRLYGSVKATNHRLNRPAVYQAVFNAVKTHSARLKPLVVSGCVSMHEKLCTYAVNQLPGGIYWEPKDPKIREVLSALSPSNDICESLLGLNDYLTTSIPNLHQTARSNLVEVRKNKTVQWLDSLQTEHQDQVINLAVACRQEVREERILEKKERDEERREKMKENHLKRQVAEKRNDEAKRKLSELHLITTIAELDEVLQEVDKSGISQSKKDAKKLQIIKTQINIRKRVLGHQIKIPYSVGGRKRPVSEIITAFHESMADFPSLPDLVCNPPLFIGHKVDHKFQVNEDGETKWYRGTIISYDSISRMHQIHYEEEDEPCYFDIILDYLNGDLKVIDS